MEEREFICYVESLERVWKRKSCNIYLDRIKELKGDWVEQESDNQRSKLKIILGSTGFGQKVLWFTGS